MTPDLFSSTPADDGPHPLPDGWRWVRLADVLRETLSNGRSVRSQAGGFPVLRLTAVRDGRLDLSETKEGEWTAEDAAPFVVKPDDFFVVRGNGSLSLVGRGALADRVDREVAFPDTLIRVRVDPERCLTEFLRHVWGSPGVREQVRSSARTTAGIYKVNQGHLEAVRFPLPPLDQQRAIVDALDALLTDLDHGVAALRDTRQRLDRYRQSVLQAAVEGRLTADWRRDHPRPEPAAGLLARALDERHRQWEADQLQKYQDKGKTPPKNWQARYKPPAALDTETLPGLPDRWMWATVDQIAAHEARSIADGPFGSNLKTAHYTEAGPRVLRLQNIGDGEFIDERAYISTEHFESLSKHHIDAGDLVVASLGEDLPRACTVPASVGPAIVKADCVRVKVNEELIDTQLAQFALNAPPTRQRTARSIHGVGRPRLSLGKLREVALPVPPRAEQAAIVDAVEDRLATTEAVAREIDAQLDRADALRRSALRHAMRGALTATTA